MNGYTEHDWIQALKYLRSEGAKLGYDDIGDGAAVAKIATLQATAPVLVEALAAIDDGDTDEARHALLFVLANLPDYNGPYAAEVAVTRGQAIATLGGGDE